MLKINPLLLFIAVIIIYRLARKSALSIILRHHATGSQYANGYFFSMQLFNSIYTCKRFHFPMKQ